MSAIFKKELKTYFITMSGYIFIGFLVLITAIFFIMYNLGSADPTYSNTLSATSISFLILIPALTMRLFADEARQKTDQLIYSSPITVGQIVIGKFLAALALFTIGMGITMIFPFIISRFGQLPVATTVGAVVGYLFLVMCFISVGLFISSLTESQVIAAVATFASLFIFYIMDGLAQVMPTDRFSSIIFLSVLVLIICYLVYDSTKNIYAAIILAAICAVGITAIYFINNLLFDSLIYNFLTWFSLLSRFDSFTIGIFNLADIIYYITFSIAFIYLTISVIEKRRWK